GLFTVTYTDRDVTSSIYYSVPSDYDSTKSYPFLLAWHGAGDTGDDMRNAVKIWLADAIGAILVCPDANNVNNHSSDYFSNLADVAYNQTRAKYNIDTNKIISMGFSWGGQFAYQLGLLNPALFRGIIGLAPAIGSLTQEMWDNINKLRMATILGTLDFNYTAVNALMLSIQNKGANLLLIIKPGVQHVDNAYFNSQAIIDDFRQCYDYVINQPTEVQYQTTDLTSDINIYPNPANDFIFINNFSGKVEIFSLEGIKLIEPENQGRIDIRELSPGVYFLKAGGKVYKLMKM
ncbi:MAG: T9SS type A sorting domain-containing protein, partial [FCB group bacterium]